MSLEFWLPLAVLAILAIAFAVVPLNRLAGGIAQADSESGPEEKIHGSSSERGQRVRIGAGELSGFHGPHSGRHDSQGDRSPFEL
jgi:hypothetical protein